MAQQPLEVYIKKGLGEATDRSNTTPTDQAETPTTKKGETDKTKSVVAAQVVNVAKQGMLIGLRNYGNITGRAKEQQAIENAINLASVAATFAVAGPYVGGAVLVGQAILGGVQSAIDQNLQERQINFNNARLGVITKNGNR